MRSVWLAPCALLALVVLCPRLVADAPPRNHTITLDDYFTLATLSEAVISPDGRKVAFTEGRWQEESNDRKSNLWVVSTTEGPARRLTDDRANDRAVQWAPDGKSLYFLGNRSREGARGAPYDGKTQVWQVGLESGEPRAVTRVEGGVAMYRLAPDGKALFYVTEQDHVDEEWKSLYQTFRDIDHGHGRTRVSLVWKLDLQTWRAQKLVDDKRYIHDLMPSPDGQKLALITTPDGKVISFEGRSRVDIVDTQTGQIASLPDKVFRAEASSPYGWLEHLAWSPDGKRLAFCVIFDAYPCEILLAEWKDREPTVRRMPRPAGLSIKGYGSPLVWAGEDRLCFLGEEKARVRLYALGNLRTDPQGKLEVLTPGDVVVQSLSTTADGQRLAAIMNDPKTFEDVYLLEAGAAPRRLTTVNPQTATWKLPTLSLVTWKSPEGVPVEGILEMPPDAKPGEQLPLIVEIHGGPTTATYYHQRFWIYGRTAFAAKGYAVLSPNYRGSTGYGDKFLTDLIGHDNDRDVADILSGVDHLISQGVADPKRMGVMGWSNGGYLTNCIISKTPRFRAASSGAGIVDTIMQWGANDEPAYMIVFKKGFPWNAAERYHKASSTYDLDKIRTPTLIHVGANDDRCPPAHSRMLYRTLREYVNVPTQLLVYPGEAHGLMKYKSRKAKMEWDHAWFDRYVIGKRPRGPMPMPNPEFFRP